MGAVYQGVCSDLAPHPNNCERRSTWIRLLGAPITRINIVSPLSFWSSGWQPHMRRAFTTSQCALLSLRRSLALSADDMASTLDKRDPRALWRSEGSTLAPLSTRAYPIMLRVRLEVRVEVRFGVRVSVSQYLGNSPESILDCECE